MVATAAVPAMAQNADKAANRAANKAAKQAQTGTESSNGRGARSNVAPASGGTQKALPSSGKPTGNIALLGAGALLAGSGILLYKKGAVS